MQRVVKHTQKEKENIDIKHSDMEIIGTWQIFPLISDMSLILDPQVLLLRLTVVLRNHTNHPCTHFIPPPSPPSQRQCNAEPLKFHARLIPPLYPVTHRQTRSKTPSTQPVNRQHRHAWHWRPELDLTSPPRASSIAPPAPQPVEVQLQVCGERRCVSLDRIRV